MSERILVADDEQEIANLIALYLQNENYEVIQVHDGLQALEYVKTEKLDLAILDVMMPGMDGFTTLREIRKVSKVPVLMLTAHGEAEDKFTGFENGADDYLPKELLLRVQAILNRVYPEKERKVFFDTAVVDLEKAIVQRNGGVITLTAKEFQLFEKLYENAGRIVTAGALCQAICGDFWQGYESTLATHIRHLREKIEENPSKPVALVTIKGIGYRLNIKGVQT